MNCVRFSLTCFVVIFSALEPAICKQPAWTLYDRKPVQILGLFGPDQREQEFAFEMAVAEANNHPDMRHSGLILVSQTEQLSPFDSFNISRAICKQTEKGIAAIFGPDFDEITSIVGSIAGKMEIPHIDTRWAALLAIKSPMSINLFPDSLVLAKAIYQVLDDMDWETFTLIYESPESLLNLQKVLQTQMGKSNYERPKITMKQLPSDPEQYRSFFKEIKATLETRIMLHCAPTKIVEILRKARSVNLIGNYQSFFITSLDAYTIDFDELANSPSNITTLRLISPLNDDVQRVIPIWQKNDSNMRITTDTVKTDTALMRDAVISFARVLWKLPRNFTMASIPCNRETDKWIFGSEIVKHMKELEFTGMSGKVAFNEATGIRNYFELDIVKLEPDGFRTLAAWNPIEGVKHARSLTALDLESLNSIANKSLRVVSKTGPPYLIKVKNDSLEGNDRFIGYSKDLMDEIAKELKFSYTLELVKDNTQGSPDKVTGKWNGLIGELRELRADLAICDFTITQEREKAVDFSVPFMSLGISILHTRPPAKASSYFSFLDPFDFTVWTYISTGYLSLSIALYAIARCTPYEWESAHPCDTDPSELENTLNFKNCLWFALGSFLQQGSDILPKALSTRLTAAMWWFFTMIVTSTYTANLAAFLTTHRMESPIKNVEDLANQDRVKYGCYINGSTASFFKNSNDSLYQRMWTAMESSNPPVFTGSNDQGVDRVLRSKNKYAFFMESSTIEYEKQKNCDLVQIGNLLDSKGYGIAMPPNSNYRKAINAAILRLKENRVLAELKTRWWKNPDNLTCDEAEDKDKDKLRIANVGGVFILLALGSAVAFFVAILEFLWNVRKVAVRERISLSAAFWLEFKFAFRCHGTTKPVRHTPQSNTLGTPIDMSQFGFEKLINKNV